jgi:hypothetical protein
LNLTQRTWFELIKDYDLEGQCGSRWFELKVPCKSFGGEEYTVRVV